MKVMVFKDFFTFHCVKLVRIVIKTNKEANKIKERCCNAKEKEKYFYVLFTAYIPSTITFILYQQKVRSLVTYSTQL